MKRNRAAVIFAVLTLFLIVFIFSNSAQEKEQSNAQSMAVTDAIKPAVDPHDRVPYQTFNHYIRKTAHFTEFAALGFLSACFFTRLWKKRLRSGLSALALSLAVAAADETIQRFSAGRGPQGKDVLLDFSGALCGVLLLLAALFLIAKLRAKKE